MLVGVAEEDEALEQLGVKPRCRRVLLELVQNRLHARIPTPPPTLHVGILD